MGRCRFGVWSFHQCTTVGVALGLMAVFMAGVVLSLRGCSTEEYLVGSVCYCAEWTCAFETCIISYPLALWSIQPWRVVHECWRER
jgi:hypothetical protein